MPKVRRRTRTGAPVPQQPKKTSAQYPIAASSAASSTSNESTDVGQHDNGGSYTPETFLEEAQAALEALDPTRARSILESGVAQHPSNADLHETLGTVLLECVNLLSAEHQALLASVPEDTFFTEGQSAQMTQVSRQTAREIEDVHVKANTISKQILATMELAVASFQTAVDLSPNTGFSKYLYLGQMSDADVALGHYRSGISILEQELEAATVQGDEVVASELRKKLSTGLCAMADIYMTDCCDNAEAEEACVQYTSRAVEVDPYSPEAHQTYASVCISRHKREEALEAAERSFALWYPIYRKLRDMGPEGAEETMESDESTNSSYIPEYPARVALAKILIELGSFATALKVVSTLINENDEDCEGLYLAAIASFFMGGGSLKEDDGMIEINTQAAGSIECLGDARDHFMQMVHVYNVIGGIDESAVEQAHHIIAAIEQVLAQSEDRLEQHDMDTDNIDA